MSWRIHQLRRLPTTLLTIFRIVREDFAVDVLDAYLWSFRGFHEHPEDPAYRARPWQKAPLREVSPADVTAIPIPEMAALLQIAMEDEEPIFEYTLQSGEGFRFLLPALGRFMGRNREQAERVSMDGYRWCEGPWCAEERRHSNTLARLIERITGQAPCRDNPNRPIAVTSSEQDAIEHLISRQTTEWNASSSYIVLAAHATGVLHTMLRNLERDEVKHLCIMSAADLYLFGPRPWKRFRDILRKGLGNYKSQQRNRSKGRALGGNWLTAVEGMTAHLLTEWFLRRWLQTIRLQTLRAVFEAPSRLAELESAPVSPQRLAEIDELTRIGAEMRVTLARWDPEARRRALEV